MPLHECEYAAQGQHADGAANAVRRDEEVGKEKWAAQVGDHLLVLENGVGFILRSNDEIQDAKKCFSWFY